MKIYLDSNVFIYAALDNGNIGEKARSIIKMVEAGIFPAATSAIAFSEITYVVKKAENTEAAIEAGKAFLRINKLAIYDYTKEISWKALEILGEYNLMPQDAIHCATMLNHGIKDIVSEDRDFRKIKEIKARSIGDIAEKFR